MPMKEAAKPLSRAWQALVAPPSCSPQPVPSVGGYWPVPQQRRPPATLPRKAVDALNDASYGWMKESFNVDLERKSHMINLANGKFHDQLVDPKTGKVDLNDINTLNKLQMLAEREIQKDENIEKGNSSWVPAFIRGGDSVGIQTGAHMDVKQAQAAKLEAQARINEINVQKKAEMAQEKIKGLMESTELPLARERDAILVRAAEGKYENPRTEAKGYRIAGHNAGRSEVGGDVDR